MSQKPRYKKPEYYAHLKLGYIEPNKFYKVKIITLKAKLFLLLSIAITSGIYVIYFLTQDEHMEIMKLLSMCAKP